MILAVQVDTDTIYVAIAGIASAVGVANMFTTRGREHDEASDRLRAALQADNDRLREENRELRTEAEKWQRRAQDWRRANGDTPWPD